MPRIRAAKFAWSFDSIFAIPPRDRIKVAYPEYNQGNWYSQVADKTIKYLFQSCKVSEEWQSALDDLEGRIADPYDNFTSKGS